MRDEAGLHIRFQDFLDGNKQEKPSSGVAICVKNTLEEQTIPLKTDIEAVAVSVKASQCINVCCIYTPINTLLTLTDLKTLISQIPMPRLTVGDFNSHNPMWGSTNFNIKGRLIEDLLAEENLNILNDGRPTRFNVHIDTTSAIDLSICDPTLSMALNWDPLPFLYGSDPYYSAISEYQPVRKWNQKNANLNKYADAIETDIE
ncbi:uncharacterized protein [Diabrotica undecimpunctata]|uniref:uncharacterized protein n=1 Tax=Diabrotica undecimpunctata TaxID=50387 RepID=UPI003B63C43D